MSKDYYIIPIFVPHFGCPHDCVFCNQRRITGLSTDVTQDYVKKTIEEHLATFPKRDIVVEVAFYGGSFTGIPKEIQRELLSIPLEFKNQGRIKAIRLSTRPDYIDDDILNLLKEYDVDTIELGVQSLCDDVLYESGRGHNSKQVYMASKLIKEHGFNLGLQMMIGLVGDSREKSIFTGKEFVKLRPYCVRIYPTLIIKDTYLEKLYHQEKYKPLTLEEAIDISTDLIMLFEYNDINVIRVGLQPTENINFGKDVIAGPFHPSFRQLVESNKYKILLKDYLDKLKLDYDGKDLTIYVHQKNISNLVGQKSSNMKYFKDRYNFKNIRVYKKDLPKDIVELNISNTTLKLDMKYLTGQYVKGI